MEPSDWAVVSVGAAVMSVGLANVAFFWKMLQQILAMNERIARVEQRVAHIEGMLEMALPRPNPPATLTPVQTPASPHG